MFEILPSHFLNAMIVVTVITVNIILYEDFLWVHRGATSRNHLLFTDCFDFFFFFKPSDVGHALNDAPLPLTHTSEVS